MKRFLLRTVLFIGLALIAVVGISVTINKWIDKKANFQIKKEASYVILGHSHVACSFNDSIIQNLVNLGQPQESFFYTVIKTKKFLPANPQFDTVLIGFSNTQIDPLMDEWTWGKKLIGGYKKYGPFFSWPDYQLLMMKNFSGLMNNFSVALKLNIGNIVKRKLDYSERIGGYQHLVGSKADSILQVRPSAKVNNGFNISNTNINYLEKLIEYCRKNGKKVYLVRSPMHEKASGLYNDELYTQIINTRFKEIEFLDFKDFPLQNEELKDLDHLNYLGAKKFSVWFDSLVKDGLFQQENKQAFINKHLHKLKN